MVTSPLLVVITQTSGIDIRNLSKIDNVSDGGGVRAK